MEEVHPLNILHTHDVNTRTRHRNPRIWVIRSKRIYELLAVALVIGGIAGEGFCEYFAAKAETAVRNFDETVAGNAEKSAHAAAADASQAKKDAKTAHDLAQSASDIATPAKATAEAAKGEAATAKTKADAVGQQADTLTGQLSAAKTELAKAEGDEQQERQTLADVTTCLAPRVIPSNGIFNPVTKKESWSTLDPVRPFSELQAIIDVVPDAEARRAAQNLEGALHTAGWTKVTLRKRDDLPDGVQVIPWNPKEIGNPQMKTPEGAARFQRNWEAYVAVSEAADAIVDWLHSFNWIVTKSGSFNPDIPMDAIEIKVGLYPAVEFVAPPGNLPFWEAERTGDRMREESRKRIEEEDDSRFEELMKKRSPDSAAAARQARKKLKEWEQRVSERYSQPCRLVDSFMP